MKKFYNLYKVSLFFSDYLTTIIRFWFYRKAVLEPANLILLHKSETAFHAASKSNKSIIYKVDNKIKRVGFLGQLSQSMTFNKDFFDYPKPKGVEIYLYELTAFGYPTNPRLTKFNHSLFEAFWHKSKYDRIFKDTFNFEAVASKINDDKLDLLIVTIEKIGRFTYGKLFNEITTSTKIIVINPGNYFQIHPKIFGQGQIQLPPCWKIINGKLISCYNYTIDEYVFFPRLFFYDRRDIIINEKVNPNFENSIFVSGRLSKIASKEYLSVVKSLLEDDFSRKFYFIGINDQNSLEFITNFFKSSSVINQIEYLGHFYMNFSENGKIEDKIWSKAKQHYKSAGIYLNPFPRGGGSSRIEAFASGLPVIDLEINYMCKKEMHKKEYILESLIKKYGTAYTHQEYYSLALKALNDLHFRKKIIEEQLKISKEFLEEKYFWKKINELIF